MEWTSFTSRCGTYTAHQPRDTPRNTLPRNPKFHWIRQYPDGRCIVRRVGGHEVATFTDLDAAKVLVVLLMG